MTKFALIMVCGPANDLGTSAYHVSCRRVELSTLVTTPPGDTEALDSAAASSFSTSHEEALHYLSRCGETVTTKEHVHGQSGRRNQP